MTLLLSNTIPNLKNWNVEKTISMCVQEKKRLMRASGGSINHVWTRRRIPIPKWILPLLLKKKLHQQIHHSTSSISCSGEGSVSPLQREGTSQGWLFQILKDDYGKEKWEHYLFVIESLCIDYSKFTWWIDSEATIHVANSLQEFPVVNRKRKELMMRCRNYGTIV